jgi:hypothetical protein
MTWALLPRRNKSTNHILEHLHQCAQYGTLQKQISHPTWAIYFFYTPPIKPKLGQQIGWGVLITNHFDQSLWWANKKYWAAVRSYLLHRFMQVRNVAAPFTRQHKLWSFDEPKPFSWAKPAYFHFSSSNCTVLDHIVKTPGDALMDL